MSQDRGSASSTPELAPVNSTSLRSFLCIVSAFAVFFAGFLTWMGAQNTVSIAYANIPPGRIVSIRTQPKSATLLRMDDGSETFFSNLFVLNQQDPPIELAVGDYIEKRRGSLSYILNGKEITNFRWVLQQELLPSRLIIPLSIYLIVGTMYVWIYSSTPIRDIPWKGMPARLPRPKEQRGVLLVKLIFGWLGFAIILGLAFNCIGCAVFGIAKAVLR